MRWRFGDVVELAAGAVLAHRLRSTLTMLGIVIGITAVVCTATDGAGNKATLNFNVTVVDSTPPVVSVNGGVTSFTVD